MRSIAEHVEIVRALAVPLPQEAVPLDAALGRTLARDVLTACALPPFDSSAMDGFAIRAADAAEVPVTLTVVADIPAGTSSEVVLGPGEAARIMTGAPVPAGADAVVPVEVTEGATGRGDVIGQQVTMREAPRPGAHIRRAGEDTEAGGAVLAAGSVIGPFEAGAAAAAGAGRLTCRALPRVAVVTTGEELTEPGHALRPGAIYDSNGYLVAAAVARWGGVPTRMRIASDAPAAFATALQEAVASHDLVVFTGGVSAGEFDVVKEVLAARGVWFGPVAMQPGKPQGAGRLGATPVLCFPGNPVSVAVSCALFLRPVLDVMLGRGTPAPVAAVAAEGWGKKPGRAQLMPVVVEAADDGRLLVRRRSPGGSGSHLATRLAGAHGFAHLPADVAEVRAGDVLHVIMDA